jgi:hypothetical protein
LGSRGKEGGRREGGGREGGKTGEGGGEAPKILKKTYMGFFPSCVSVIYGHIFSYIRRGIRY